MARLVYPGRGEIRRIISSNEQASGTMRSIKAAPRSTPRTRLSAQKIGSATGMPSSEAVTVRSYSIVKDDGRKMECIIARVPTRRSILKTPTPGTKSVVRVLPRRKTVTSGGRAFPCSKAFRIEIASGEAVPRITRQSLNERLLFASGHSPWAWNARKTRIVRRHYTGPSAECHIHDADLHNSSKSKRGLVEKPG
jgi:hypothetical protein